MKLTHERLRQNAAAMLSLADGKPIQYRMRSDYAGDMDWKDYDPDSRAPDYGTWEYRPKPEPKVRPWKGPADVPGPVCWIRQPFLKPAAFLVVGVGADIVRFHDSSGAVTLTFSNTDWSKYEHSTDRLNWFPCAVTEEA